MVRLSRAWLRSDGGGVILASVNVPGE
jgi:hypothetical protein